MHIQDEIAEMIHIDDCSFDSPSRLLRFSEIQVSGPDLRTLACRALACGEECSRWREYIPAVEGVGGRERNCDLVSRRRPEGARCGQEQAVIRSDKNMPSALHNQTQPICSHAWINHGYVDGAFRKISDRREQGESTGAHILGRDVVGNIHKGYVYGFILQPA